MTSSLAKVNKSSGVHFRVLFLKFPNFLMFLNIQIYLLMLKTYDGQFNSTTQKNHCISSLTYPTTITHADSCHSGRVFQQRLCVCPFFHTLSQKIMQLRSPNLAQNYSTMIHEKPFISGSKDQKSRSRCTKNKSVLIFRCREILLPAAYISYAGFSPMQCPAA